LESTDRIGNAWLPVPQAVSPLRVRLEELSRFYRLRR